MFHNVSYLQPAMSAPSPNNLTQLLCMYCLTSIRVHNSRLTSIQVVAQVYAGADIRV